jgi:hypothetical protein
VLSVSGRDRHGVLKRRRGQVIARQTGAVPLAALRTWADNALAATG